MAPWPVELGTGADKDCVNLQVPTTCSGVPAEILNPANQWKNKGEFDATLGHLADLYQVREDYRRRLQPSTSCLHGHRDGWECLSINVMVTDS